MHFVDLPGILGHDGHQRLIFTIGIVCAFDDGRQFVSAAWEVG